MNEEGHVAVGHPCRPERRRRRAHLGRCRLGSAASPPRGWRSPARSMAPGAPCRPFIPAPETVESFSPFLRISRDRIRWPRRFWRRGREPGERFSSCFSITYTATQRNAHTSATKGFGAKKFPPANRTLEGVEPNPTGPDQ